LTSEQPRQHRLTIVALISGVVLVLLGLFNSVPFSERAQDYTQEIATSAGITYASLRGINAAISFVEEVEIQGSVVIASGSINPFKFLEPLDDAVERLSSAIFLVAGTAAILSVLLATIGKASFVLIGGSLIVSAALKFTRPIPFSATVERLLERVFQLGLMGVLIVLAFAISSVVADRISDQSWESYNAILDEAGAAGETLEESGDSLTAAAESLDQAKEIVVTLVARSDELIAAIIGVFAAFLFKTIALPLVLSFALLWVVRRPVT
jgi:hypothetical protein